MGKMNWYAIKVIQISIFNTLNMQYVSIYLFALYVLKKLPNILTCNIRT